MPPPKTADEFAALSDAELVALASDYGAHASVTAQIEMTRRHIVALRAHKCSADRAALALVVLTVVIAAFTVALFFNG